MGTVIYELSQGFQFIINHIVFINVLLSVVIVFFQRKEPKSVWAWLLILYSIPILGFIIYLLAGTDMHKRKMFKIKEIEDQINDAIRQQEYSIKMKKMEESYPEITEFSDLVYYNLGSSHAIVTDDNELKIFTDGNEKFDTLIEDMKRAEKSIHVQYYIIKEDEVFERIKAVLLEKAKEGVEVRILFDAMGCRSVRHQCWKNMEKGGIQVAEFFPALFRRLHLRINYRNHRKIVVIDGEIAYVGGFNVAKEYIGLDDKFGYWRDTHLRIAGMAALELQIRFVLDWNYAARKNLFSNPDYFVIPEQSPGDTVIQIISSGPDSMLQNIRNNYLRLIGKAQKAIYIQTPYFIPDEAILHALIVALYSGIEVHLMIPCKPDHPFVYWATYSYMGDLIMAGANCYTYSNGFLHAKGMIVDGKVFCYGTANMDIRSFQLNFEVNAVVYSEREAQKMQEIFMQDVAKCRKITKSIYTKRPWKIRIKEQFCRLLSPLL